ncbi:MAG: hypothetical protein WKG00_24235 [Polyangiaceae bacterium]
MSRRLALGASLAVAAALHGAGARAQTPPAPADPAAAGAVPAGAASCMLAYEAGQEQQQRGELLAARATLRDCSTTACPEVVRDQCVLQIEELAAQQPTVVLAARDAQGRDTTAVVVTIDGKRAADRLGGLAVPLDPGGHRVRFESGGAVREVSVVVAVGEKNRKVMADFYVAPTGTAAAAPAADAPAAGGVPTATWVLGGVGVVGLGSFMVWGLVGRGQEDKLDTCRIDRSCSEGKVDGMYRSYTIADISLGVGILAIGAATLTYALAPRSRATATHANEVRIGSGPGDFGASLRGAL